MNILFANVNNKNMCK